MPWEAQLRREALHRSFEDFDLAYHVSLRPPIPAEYDVPGLVGLTFRLRPRPRGGFVYVTVIDAAAAARLGERIGLDPGEAIAMVDSHERLHVALQLADVAPEQEEQQLRLADAVWLSLRHPKAAELLRAGEFGLVTRVEEGFWEALIDTTAEPPP